MSSISIADHARYFEKITKMAYASSTGAGHGQYRHRYFGDSVTKHSDRPDKGFVERRRETDRHEVKQTDT